MRRRSRSPSRRRRPRAARSSLPYSLEDDYGVVTAHSESRPARRTEAAEGRPSAVRGAVAPPVAAAAAHARRQRRHHPRPDLAPVGRRQGEDDARRQGRGQSGRPQRPDRRSRCRRAASQPARAGGRRAARQARPGRQRRRPRRRRARCAHHGAGEDHDDAGVYLALRSAYRRLVTRADDDALRGVVDYLWKIALGIEDGDLSMPRQALAARRRRCARRWRTTRRTRRSRS